MAEPDRDADLENIIGQELVTDIQLKKLREVLAERLRFREGVRTSKKLFLVGGRKYRLTIRLEEVRPTAELPEGVPEPVAPAAAPSEAEATKR
jgi:hypothetical protein